VQSAEEPSSDRTTFHHVANALESELGVRRLINLGCRAFGLCFLRPAPDLPPPCPLVIIVSLIVSPRWDVLIARNPWALYFKRVRPTPSGRTCGPPRKPCRKHESLRAAHSQTTAMLHRSIFEIVAWLGLATIVFAAFLSPLLAWYFG
jgi:hypothetical protein